MYFQFFQLRHTLFYCIFPIMIYPPYTLFHLYPLPTPQKHHTVIHDHEFSLFISFAHSLHLSKPHQSCQPAVYESVSTLLLHFSLCSLNSTWVKSYGICLSLVLNPLTTIFSMSILAVTKGKMFFFFMAWWYFIV